MRAIIQWLQDFNGAVTAAATVSIAIFTFVLAVVTRKQIRLGNATINLARNEFNATHRPRIFVQSVARHWPDGERAAQAHFWIANGGDSEATIMRYVVHIYGFVDGITFWPSIEEPEPVILKDAHLKAGERMLICDSKMFPVAWAMSRQGIRVFIVGRVEYSGPDSSIHITGFCREYIEGESMWRRVDNSEYEYAY